jgi:NADH-quinone oxidoreductase subunit M
MVIVGTFQARPAAAIIATVGVILAALYILIAYQRIFTGPPREDLADTPDLNARELLVIGPLIAALLVLGFYPAPAVDVMSDDAVVTMSAFNSPPGDPAAPPLDPSEGSTP